MEKNKINIPKWFVWAIFAAVILTHLFLAVKWQGQFFIYSYNNTYPFAEAVFRAYQDVATSRCDFLALYKKIMWVGVGRYWPPVMPMIGLWTLLIFSGQCFFLPNIFYLAAIMLGIYFSTRFLICNDLYGMIAAVIFSCYWSVIVQLVAFDRQLIATACIVWGFYWYLRSFFFSRFWPSLLATLFIIVGLYCDRFTPGVFIFPLLLVPENFKNKRAFFLMFMTMILVVICAWPFYGSWIKGFISPEGMRAYWSQGGDYSPPSGAYQTILRNPQFLREHLSYYFISLTERLLGYGFTVLMLLGSLSLHRLKKPYAQVLWIAILIPLIAFIGVFKKEFVYIFPLCIYFAMISAIGIYFIRQKRVRYLLIILVAGLASMQYFFLFNPSSKINNMLFSGQFGKMAGQKVPRIFWSDYPPPDKEAAGQARLIVAQIIAMLNKKALLGERKQAMIIDLLWIRGRSTFNLHFSAICLLRIQRVKVINVNFAVANDAMDCKEDHLYLLSSDEQYAGKNAPRSCGGCSWKRLEPLLRFSGGEITLYQVIQ